MESVLIETFISLTSLIFLLSFRVVVYLGFPFNFVKDIELVLGLQLGFMLGLGLGL